MITKEEIQKLIEDKLKDDNLFLVELQVLPSNVINVELDGYEGVTIQQCVDFSRQIENNLDREEEDFELHVSSPGLDKPLRVYQQYEKNVGREVKVVPLEGNVIKGRLTEVNEKEISIEYSVKKKIEGKKKKETIIEKEIIPFTNIKETTIIISFK